MERLIADTWKEVLKLSEVGIYDNLFDVGGNSLAIIQIYGKLKRALNRDLPVVTLYRYPTIGTLARYNLCERTAQNPCLRKPADRLPERRWCIQ